MRKLAIVCSLLVLVILGLGDPVWAVEPPFSIEAEDHLAVDEKHQLVEAKGQVVIEFAENEIRADEVLADLQKEEIIARGNVVLIEDGQKIKGSGLRYNYGTGEGTFEDSLIEEEGITYRGRQVNIKPDSFEVEDSFLTPCTHGDDPHYHLTADKVTIYPGEELVAEGVWFWAGNTRLVPLFTYRMKLSDKEGQELERKEGERASFPEPGFGFNSDDGAYIDLSYYHYLGDDSDGETYLKATTEATHRARLDYNLRPNEQLTFNPLIDYRHHYGLDYGIGLEAEYENYTSDFNYESFIERDDGDSDYQQRKWEAYWDLGTEWRGVEADFSLKRPEALQEVNKDLEQELTLRQSWSDYYWQLEGARNTDVEYKPQATLGVRDKNIGANNKLGAELKTGRIWEDDTGIETNRHRLHLGLSQEFDLTERTRITGQEKFVYSQYGTGDSYQTYDLRLGASQEYRPVDINLDYQFYDEYGASPFKFDDLLDDGLGRRHTVGINLGKSGIETTDNLTTNWNLFGRNTYYEDGNQLGRYGGQTGFDYQIDQFNQISLAYDYQRRTSTIEIDDDNLDDEADEINFIEEEDLEVVNELTGSYRHQTNRGEWPYNDHELTLGYDFVDEELSRAEYSFTREYDCFNLGFNTDQIEGSYDFQLNFKY